MVVKSFGTMGVDWEERVPRQPLRDAWPSNGPVANTVGWAWCLLRGGIGIDGGITFRRGMPPDSPANLPFSLVRGGKHRYLPL